MTQKELLYVEDAIMHENNIINICEDMVNTLDNDELSDFIDNEIGIHTGIRENLMGLLEDKIDE
ncbi:MAG: hypothetical protein J5970_03435 [Bacilli bacterium]|jgi:hypothetical protein|nr:hypothetical protein [Bacilli bacterium]